MANYVILKLDEVSLLSDSLEHELTRVDDVPVDPQHLLDRVNAMIEAFIQSTRHPRKEEDLLDFISEEFEEYRYLIDVVTAFIDACHHASQAHRTRPNARLRSIRVVDLRSDVVLQLS